MDKHYKENRIKKRLKGYISHPRERFFLLQSKVLTPQEFVVYEFYLSIADWDKKHSKKFTTFYAPNKDVATYLGYKADSTISRIRTTLLEKGLILWKPELNRFEVPDFKIWTCTLPAKVQAHIAEMEIELAEMQKYSANLQEVKVKSVSYKEDVVLSKTKYSDYSLEELLNDDRTLDQLNTTELFLISKHFIGDGTRVTCGSEVME